MDNSTENNCIVLSKDTVKRLIKDVKCLIKNPLDNEGIYYKHDEENILKGYAYICGPEDSIYFGGNYFFEFIFPHNYPHSPPTVTFLNKGGGDGVTRFHPNMYKTGKVCLSILNTWVGDQWTGCQSIRSVLVTLISIMDNEPLLHEPGFRKSSPDFLSYHKIIIYKNLEYSVCYILQNKLGYLQNCQKMFKTEIETNFKKNKESLKKIIDDLKCTEPCEYFTRAGVYNMNVQIDWNYIHSQFNKITL
jgi:ubiquitin-protein ligase